MFHMLSCFNLESDVTIEEFQQSIVKFTSRMQEMGAVESISPIGRRQRHPIMDTDDERDHEYFFTMSFRDREQCDQAVDYILPHKEPEETVHNAMSSKIADPIFICWEDI